MTKFTQEPWTWADRGLLGVNSSDIGIYIKDEERPFKCGHLIGSLKTTDDNRSTQTANAQLMIASPTMYNRMYNALASLSKGTSEGVREAIE